MAQQGTGTPQDPIKTKLYFQKKGLVYEVGGGGGGSGGSTQYIKTPVILSPVNEATGVSVLATIRVSEYENLFESDAWANRHVQIATVGEFTAESIVYDHMEMATEFQVTEPALPANTVCYVRAKDYSADGLESEWSNIVMFTTGEAITVNKPELQLFGWHESTSDFVQTIKATASEFSVTQGQIDNHIKTDWWIEQATTRSNVHIWESMGDLTNLTSITTPEIEALQPSTKYVFCCVYYGEKFGASPVSMKEFTTSSDFGKVNTPTLSVEGGPSDVYETPTLTATAFSNTRDPDTHISTDWKIVLASDAGGSPVWESTSDMVNKTEITVPKGRLQAGTSYIAMVQYNGQVYGLSDWAQYQFSTVPVFASVNTPTLTVEGAPSSVGETPTLTLSAFGGTNVSYKQSHFKVLKNEDNSEVWSTTVSSASARVPRGLLQTSTLYKFQGWHESIEGALSDVVSVTAQTKEQFAAINDIGTPDSPTFGVGICSDEEAEAFIPGMTKHPDFYDETKAGYGSWVLPSKNYNNGSTTTTFSGTLKYIPKFYWHPLFKGVGGFNSLLSDAEIEALVPYVGVTKEQMIRVRDKYPHSGVVFASASAFANESEANAQGFILPAAFIDGGKEKNGFFIAPTLTTLKSDPAQDADIYFGETYSTEQTNTDLCRLDGHPNHPGIALPPSTTSTLKDAIALPRWYSSVLCGETCFTVAALALISLCVAQYSSSRTECAWYDANVANFPKGINNGGASDIDDPDVALATAINSGQGSVFPTTQEGYCKTTHNGRINGITHVNGWLTRPMVGIGAWAGEQRLFDCGRHSISNITTDNVQSDTIMFQRISTGMGGDWAEEANTPLYVWPSGQDRQLNCVCPHSKGNTSSTFGHDFFSLGGNSIMVCGGGGTSGIRAGIFFRDSLHNGGYLSWDATGGGSGFRVIGYSTLNSDGLIGGGVEPEPEPVDSETLSDPAIWAGTVITYYAEPKVKKVPPEEYNRHYEVYDIDLLVDVSAANMSDNFSGCEIGYYLDDDFSTEEFFGEDTPTLTYAREGTKVRIKGTFQFTNVNGGWAQLELKLYRGIGASNQGTVIGLKYSFWDIRN